MNNQITNDYAPHTNEPDQMVHKMKHSGFGIASFATSLAFALGLFALVVVAGVIEMNSPEGMDEESTTAVVNGLLLFAGIFGEDLAIILGIVGVAQSSHKKVFGILGISISLLTFALLAALIVLGMTAG